MENEEEVVRDDTQVEKTPEETVTERIEPVTEEQLTPKPEVAVEPIAVAPAPPIVTPVAPPPAPVTPPKPTPPIQTVPVFFADQPRPKFVPKKTPVPTTIVNQVNRGAPEDSTGKV